jgi:hypothetical protein
MNTVVRCGVDCGSTLIKAAVQTKDGRYFFSTRDFTKEKLIGALKELKVSKVFKTGIGKYDLPFPVIYPTKDPIDHEIDTQVLGTQYLLKQWGEKQGFEVPTEYCLIAAGTGASYTIVEKKRVGGDEDYWVRLPHGSAFAGGFLSKLANHIYTGYDSYRDDEKTLKDMDGMASYAQSKKQPSADLFLKDIDPASKEDLLIASCGKLPPPFPWRQSEQLAAALVEMTATALLDKFLMYRYCWAAKNGNIVLIGSLAAMPSFQTAFRRLALPLGLIAYFPPNGEYAGALGALLSIPEEIETVVQKEEELPIIGGYEFVDPFDTPFDTPGWGIPVSIIKNDASPIPFHFAGF